VCGINKSEFISLSLSSLSFFKGLLTLKKKKERAWLESLRRESIMGQNDIGHIKEWITE
jgi:hypothetical protein